MSFVANKDISHQVSAGIDSWHLRSLGTLRKYIFTAVSADDLLTVTGNPFVNTDTVNVAPNAGATLPAGIAEGVVYFVISVSGNAFQLAATSGGSPIDLTTDGSGTLFITRVDAAYYSLKNLYDGKIDVKNISRNESHGQPITRGAILSASGKIMDTSKTNLLKTLDKLSSKKFAQVINMFGGSLPVSSIGLAIPTFGLKWIFNCVGDSDKDRYLEVMASRRIIAAEISALLGTAAPSYGTPIATDDLYLLNSLSNQNSICAGFESISLADVYNATFQEVGSLMNCSLIMELLTNNTSLGEDEGYNIKIDVSADALQASDTESAQLQTLSTQAHFLKVKLLGDGTIITLGNSSRQQAGINWNFLSDKDADGNRIIKYSGSGIVKASELDAIFA